MAKKNFVNKLLSNTRKPEGFLGRLMLRGMNTGHAGLAKWGMSCLKWQLHWTVLDIGCGGGANLAQILRYCPLGKAYGVDLSPESVAFAKKKNRKELEVNCFVEQGSADSLPHTDGMFDVVTPSTSGETWTELSRKWHVYLSLAAISYYAMRCVTLLIQHGQTVLKEWLYVRRKNW